MRRSVSLFSQLLMKTLQESAEHRVSDPADQYQLGRVALECIAFRRSLLQRRRGPKWTEQEQLRKMEQQVNSFMANLEKVQNTNKNTNKNQLSSVSKELKEFWRQRKKLRKQ